MNKHLLRASVVALAIAAPVAAQAYEKGDFIVRAGAAHVQPNEDSGEVPARWCQGFRHQGDPEWRHPARFDLRLHADQPCRHRIAGRHAVQPYRVRQRPGPWAGRQAGRCQTSAADSVVAVLPDGAFVQISAVCGRGYQLHHVLRQRPDQRPQEPGFQQPQTQGLGGSGRAAGHGLHDHRQGAGQRFGLVRRHRHPGHRGRPVCPGGRPDQSRCGYRPWVYMVGVGYKF